MISPKFKHFSTIQRGHFLSRCGTKTLFMKAKFLVLSAASFLILLLSCNKDDSSQTVPLPEATGTLNGKVMVKNGSKPVGGATVFVLNDQSKLYYTRTDAAGNFSLKAPVGQRKLHIQMGGGANFRTVIDVNVLNGQTLTIQPGETRLQQVASMAYVAGSYDEIESIVTDLGYSITALTNANLDDYALVSQFDVIFLNCGAKENFSATTDTNLANFVSNGGSLYASDWAVAYLIGGQRYTGACNEAGGFIADDKLCAINNGSATTISGAQVTDADLAASVGFSNLDIQYDLGSWEQITNFDPAFWEVEVSNPANGAALMIKTKNFSGGTQGSPVGQGAADEGWITICHNEPGVEPFTITITEEEWPMHEAHGDALGECSNANNSGTIYYTTFHNHAGGNIGNAGLILQYVILNL